MTNARFDSGNNHFLDSTKNQKGWLKAATSEVKVQQLCAQSQLDPG
jgi:hypothetical protein